MPTFSSFSRKALHLSGRDSSGITAAFCRLCAQRQTRFLHLSQMLVHGYLSINAELEIQGDDCEPLLRELRAWSHAEAFELVVTDLPDSYETLDQCGLYTTVLGNERTGAALPEIIETLRNHGMIV